MFKLKFYIQTFVIMALMISLPACSLINKVTETSSEKISELVIQYCAETNETFRLQLREKINLKMAGQATIEVNCSPQTTEAVYGTDNRNHSDRWRYSQYSNRVFPLESAHENQPAGSRRIWRPSKSLRLKQAV